MSTSTNLGGFYIESDFFDGDNFYVNAVFTERPTRTTIARATEIVEMVAEQMAYAMNGVEGVPEHDDNAWTVYESEWWNKNGVIIEDEDGWRHVRIVQSTIRR